MRSPGAYNPRLRREGLCTSGPTSWLADPTHRRRAVQNPRTVESRTGIVAAREAAEVPLPIPSQLYLRRDTGEGCVPDPARRRRNGEGECVNDSRDDHPPGTLPTDTLDRKDAPPSPESPPAKSVSLDASGTEGLKNSEIIEPTDVWSRLPREVPARLVERLSRVARRWQDTHSCLGRQP